MAQLVHISDWNKSFRLNSTIKHSWCTILISGGLCGGGDWRGGREEQFKNLASGTFTPATEPPRSQSPVTGKLRKHACKFGTVNMSHLREI